MQTYYISTTIGAIEIITNDNCIVSAKTTSNKTFTSDTVSKKLRKEINNYLSGKSVLRFKYKIYGTKFQLKVWDAICNIPSGQTMTYSELAISIGMPTAVRAVANACGQNKIMLYVPCHRVVGKNNIGGYKWGIELKQQLLDTESS